MSDGAWSVALEFTVGLQSKEFNRAKQYPKDTGLSPALVRRGCCTVVRDGSKLFDWGSPIVGSLSE
jgi:hypothetical protein